MRMRSSAHQLWYDQTKHVLLPIVSSKEEEDTKKFSATDDVDTE